MSFFEGAHVTADGEACFEGAVIFEGVALVFQCLNVRNECGLSFGAGEGEIGGADGSAGGGERGCFSSFRALLRFLPCVSVLKSDAVAVQFSEILYRWGPFLFVGGAVIPRDRFNLNEVGAGIHILDEYYDLLSVG